MDRSIPKNASKKETADVQEIGSNGMGLLKL
jgi:hypothetical protein